ncbi:baseplate J/gp47 family protein [Acinetobacter soli]|uniref:baseplate J/gp47 family protein n=1 Tax=Acinetobacter soli TaxID=487316 RepID=UPI00125E73F7|nr:baseplate J/gp47 family protein [Acinetobacter soli]
MTITTVAPVVNDAGVIAPTYYEIVEYLKQQYRTIYGEDAYLENDSQDGQWIGVQSRAIADVNAAIVTLYSSFSPKTAVKEALSRNVAINGIKRALPTFSTVDLVITGTSGTTINNGYANDVNGNKWLLPATVTIPSSGSITVTATASVAGAVLAMAGTVTIIGKPTRGWLGVDNTAASSIGTSIENDAKLRQRQALSVAIPSQSKTDSIKGAIFSLSGVSRCKTYENDSDQVDSLGIPANSLCVVVSGGDVQQIAQIMRAKKSMGCGYFGNTAVSVLDTFQQPVTINLYRPNIRNVGFLISMEGTTEYTSEIGKDIKQAMADYVNQLDIGDRITLNKIYIPAGLYGNLDSRTYEITSITIQVDGIDIDGDFSLAFNEVAYCDTDNIEINISGGP